MRGGSVTSAAATLTVNAAPVPPSITTQPASTFAFEPTAAIVLGRRRGHIAAELSVAPQRRAIPGATSASYILNPTTAGDSGASFSVVVSNCAGSVTSAAATLSVFGPGVDGGAMLVDAHFDTMRRIHLLGRRVPRHQSAALCQRRVHVTSGGFTGGALKWRVGGINSQNILEHVGRLAAAASRWELGRLSPWFRYRLTEQPTYETDEFSQTLVSLDGVLRGVAERLHRPGRRRRTDDDGLAARADRSRHASAGTHVLALGGYNNKKSYPDESAEVLIDDVLVLASAGGCVDATEHHDAAVQAHGDGAERGQLLGCCDRHGPLSYQWRRNGAPYRGATSTSY